MEATKAELEIEIRSAVRLTHVQARLEKSLGRTIKISNNYSRVGMKDRALDLCEETLDAAPAGGRHRLHVGCLGHRR